LIRFGRGRRELSTTADSYWTNAAGGSVEPYAVAPLAVRGLKEIDYKPAEYRGARPEQYYRDLCTAEHPGPRRLTDLDDPAL